MSYFLDSRNENVQLDYNNLRISSPTTFTREVLGYTWPRQVSYTRAALAIPANTGTTIQWPALITSSNTFTSETPVLTTALHIVPPIVANFENFTLVSSGTWTISWRVALTNLATALMDYQVTLQRSDDGGGTWVGVDTDLKVMATVVAPFNTLSGSVTFYFNGFQPLFRLSYISSEANTVTPFLSFFKLK